MIEAEEILQQATIDEEAEEEDDDVITELDKSSEVETDEDALFPMPAHAVRVKIKSHAFINNKVRMKTKHCKICSRPNWSPISKEVHKLADQYDLDHLNAIELVEELQCIPEGAGNELIKLKRQLVKNKGEPPQKKPRGNRVGSDGLTAKERHTADLPSLDDPLNRMSVSDSD